MVRAVAYTRVSTEEQAADDKVSLSNQEQDIKAYCQRKGYDLLHTYTDAGYSGSTRNRPAFREMLIEAAAESFEVIICWRGDRLTRALRPTVALKDALEGTDIEIEASNDVINRRWLSLKAAMAEEELEAIKERSRMGARGRASKGQVKGKVKFGYCMGADGKPEIVGSQAEIVRYIFQLYKDGLGCQAVARRLNDESIPSPKGDYWYPRQVWSILANPCYAGNGQWGRRKFFKKDDGQGQDVTHLRYTPEEQWLSIPYPPIIDPETFKATTVRRNNQTRQRTGKKANLEYPLKGKLWCAQHGKLYTTHYSSWKDTWLCRYYVCNQGGRFKDRYGACSQPSIKADDIEQRVSVWTYRFLLEPERLERLKDDYMHQLREGGGLDVLERARKAIDELEAQKARVLYQHQIGAIDNGELDFKLRNIRDQQELRQDELEQAETSYASLADQLAALESLGDKAQRQAAWKALNQQGREQLVKSIIKQVRVTSQTQPDDLECVVNFSALICPSPL